MTGIVCRDATFLEVMETLLSVKIALKEKYNEKFDVTSIVDILNDMKCNTFVIGIGVKSYFGDNRLPKMMLRL